MLQLQGLPHMYGVWSDGSSMLQPLTAAGRNTPEWQNRAWHDSEIPHSEKQQCAQNQWHLMLAGLKAGARPLRKRRQVSSVAPLTKSGRPLSLVI